MLLPVVAIVGRPNVGKSTLFNCLTRTRDAIVSAYPGTTRDRQYGEVNSPEQRFILIDTGGIGEENKNDAMHQLISQQAHQAILDADKILFVVDARTGITADDKLIADILRRAQKPIFVVVNKAEGLDPNISVADAYELGMPKPIPVSAAHGSGMAQLIDALFPSKKVEEEEEEEERKAEEEHIDIDDEEIDAKHAPNADDDYHLTGIKLAIVGRPNVGKSTLTNRMLGEDRVIVHDTAGTTRDSIFVPLERFDQRYTLIDTAGVRRRTKISEVPEKFSVVKTLQAIENCNVVLYIVDARLGVSDQDLKLLGFILECGKGLVIAVNKWDGMTEEAREHARATIDRHLDFVRFARVHFISALHGSGVGNLFDSINEAYASATKKLSTPKLSELLQQAIITHSPPMVHGRRIKLRYAHAGGHNPPRVIIHGNQLNALPESYRKFLAAFFQKKLQLFGTPVQIIFKTSNNPFAKKKK